LPRAPQNLASTSYDSLKIEYLYNIGIILGGAGKRVICSPQYFVIIISKIINIIEIAL